MSTFEAKVQDVYYKGVDRLNKECILEESNNNTHLALRNYSNLIQYLDSEIEYLAKLNSSTTTTNNELQFNQLLQLKDKVNRRKDAIEIRLNNNEQYRLDSTSQRNLTSYASFFSAFSKKSSTPNSTSHSSNLDFIIPSLPQKSIISTQKPNERPKSFILNTKSISNSTSKTRKSLDLPRQRSTKNLEHPKTHSRSKSSTRVVDPVNSTDVILNAATLAWDQRKPSPPSRSSSPVTTNNDRIVSGSKLSNGSKKKYEYTQPTVSTRINLTPVSNTKIRSPTLGNISKFDSTNNKPNTTNDQNFHQRTKSKVEKPLLVSEITNNKDFSSTVPQFDDPRINQMLETAQGVDIEALKQILNEILVTGEKLTWDDLAGLSTAKKSLKETVVYPFLRPDLFQGLREPISGMLLFGPPGTGKTMIAKTVANESKSTFFSVSASSLLSKFLGESEKLIRALFYAAKILSPSIIFFDEIDSLLSSRGNNEHESSRRVKTEFLIQWSNLSSATANNNNESSRVLVLAATNLPWSIDDAARRRFTRRLYIPLPEFETRLVQLHKLFQHSNHTLSQSDFVEIARITEGYSNSDITSLSKEAAMEPIRDLGENLISINNHEIRGVKLGDFLIAMQTIKKSVSKETLDDFEKWAERFGSTGV
ncbi:hypothetical protein WICMUC_001251 [Wickerhamomyces mucosus]|uniref:AAA+ ATPase domain-containing protein n=1 Tax=Wickerhamomyces mucosus TaxID=1378264 RepID=A0A9P8THZ5_9ASCO|nr:hypothetical protein WICMUC_001251 [Wickerhamomyces mucosus]